MFHLVNSVYVNLEMYMDRVHPHYNLSGHTGFKAVVADGSLEHDSINNQIDFAQSLDEMEPSKMKRWFRNMLANDGGRMMVWVDPENYAALFGGQLLAMDPDMDIETFTYFLTMAKVKFSTTILTMGTIFDMSTVEMDVKDVIPALYRLSKRVGPIMRDTLYSNPKKWSIEWRIKHLVETGECLGIKANVERLHRRNLIISCVEALSEIQHIVGDPSNWERLGCNLDTLLGSSSAFKGLLAYNHINSDWLLSNDPYSQPVTLTQIVDAAREAIDIFTIAGDQHMIDRTGYHIETLEMFQSGELTTLEMVDRLFGGRIHGCRVNDTDSSKYNESIIKYFLSKAK